MATDMTKDKVDVVIVGAGAAGAIMAQRLAAGGKKVVTLEIGPNWAATNLVSSQIWAHRIKWGKTPFETAGTDPANHNFNVGWGTGGSAIHHYAQWPRMHVEDFRMKSLFGRGADWPISYDDLRPYYDRVQEEIGISGDHVKEIWRPAGAPYPMPPIKLFRQSEVLAAAFAKVGIRTAPMPFAINSRSYKGRPACIYDGWCDAGCPTGALANPLFTHWPQALEAGAVLTANAEVTRVLTDNTGKRATGVEYYDAKGARHEQHADVVILANNAFQSSRVLLNSANAKHPNGLANSSGTVGQYFLSHFATNVNAIFDEDLEASMGVTGSSLISQEEYAKPEGSYTWFLSNAHKPNDLGGLVNMNGSVFGQELHTFMRDAVRGMASTVAIGEQLPRAENRVVLNGKKDAYGMQGARWENGLIDAEKKLAAKMRAEGANAMKAGGAKQVFAPEGIGWQHVAGGTRMGSSPTDSVCDSYGRTHDVANLVVAGAALFPTQGAVNPTFTVHALTQRSADHMLANWKSYAA